MTGDEYLTRQVRYYKATRHLEEAFKLVEEDALPETLKAFLVLSDAMKKEP